MRSRGEEGSDGEMEEDGEVRWDCTSTNLTFLLTSFPLLDMWMMSWSENMRALCVSSRQCPHSTWPARGGRTGRCEEGGSFMCACVSGCNTRGVAVLAWYKCVWQCKVW